MLGRALHLLPLECPPGLLYKSPAGSSNSTSLCSQPAAPSSHSEFVHSHHREEKSDDTLQLWTYVIAAQHTTTHTVGQMCLWLLLLLTFCHLGWRHEPQISRWLCGRSAHGVCLAQISTCFSVKFKLQPVCQKFQLISILTTERCDCLCHSFTLSQHVCRHIVPLSGYLFMTAAVSNLCPFF